MNNTIPMFARTATLALLTGCLAMEPDTEASPEVALASSALEVGCLLANTAATVELNAERTNVELVTINPFTRSTAQDYSSLGCSGFVGEITNPNGYSVNELFAGGGGWVRSSADRSVFGSEERCRSMRLEVDVYGYRNGITTPLGSGNVRGTFLPNDYQDEDETLDRCKLSYALRAPGNYELFRIVARVSNQTATYPIRMGAW